MDFDLPTSAHTRKIRPEREIWNWQKKTISRSAPVLSVVDETILDSFSRTSVSGSSRNWSYPRDGRNAPLGGYRPARHCHDSLKPWRGNQVKRFCASETANNRKKCNHRTVARSLGRDLGSSTNNALKQLS